MSASPSSPRVTTAVYDGLSRTTQTKMTSDPYGTDYVNITYDGVNHVASMSNPFRTTSDPTYGVITYSYDALGRKVVQFQSDGISTLQWCYDNLSYAGQTNCRSHFGTGSGTWIDVADESKNDRQLTADALGHTVEVAEEAVASSGTTSPLAMETDYTYGVLGNLSSVTQWGGPSGSSGARTRSFSYDSLLRLIQTYNPENGWICYGTTGGAAPNGSNCTESYDANGNLLAKTDGRGFTNSFQYDALNRKTFESSTAPNTYNHYFYYDQPSQFGITFLNPVGRLTLTETALVVNNTTYLGAATVYWNHDQMGRVLGAMVCVPSGCNGSNIASSSWINLSDTYNAAGDIASYTDGFSTTVHDNYDGAGRISSVSTAQGSNAPVTLWTANGYSAIGLTQATFQNGEVETFSYDKRERRQSTSTDNSVGQVIYSEPLTFDSVGNVQTANDSINGNWTYTYDTLNRLTTAVSSNTGQGCQFTYDSFGNRKQESAFGGSCLSPAGFTFTSTSTNQIDQYCYDAAGNLVDEGPCPAPGTNHQFFYDGYGNLLSPNFNGSPRNSYAVDSMGRRVAKYSGGSIVQQYAYGQDGNPLVLVGPTGNWLQTNVYAGGRLLAEFAGSTSPTYFHTDHLGTVRLETGAQNVTCTNLPFGESLACSSGSNPAGIHFTSKEHDSESGNDYFGARYYAPSIGRFVSPDWSAVPWAVPYASLANPQSLNLYAYTTNNPLNFTDPTGHWHQKCKQVPASSVAQSDGVIVLTTSYQDCELVPDFSDYLSFLGDAFKSHFKHAWHSTAGFGRGMMDRWKEKVEDQEEGNSVVTDTNDTVGLLLPRVSEKAAKFLGPAGAVVSLANDPSPQNIALTGIGLIPGPDVPVAIYSVAQDGSEFIADYAINPVFKPDALQSDTIVGDGGVTLPDPGAVFDRGDGFN